MYVIECDNIVYVDIDSTIIDWSFNPNIEKIKITCDGMTKFYNPIQTNIEYLKEHRYRGHRVVIWSHGGWKWAKAVVKALKLEKYVDVVASKPRWIIDDLEANEWMPKADFAIQQIESKYQKAIFDKELIDKLDKGLKASSKKAQELKEKE